MNTDSFAHDQAPSRSDDATCRRALAALLLCAGFAAGTPAFGQSAQTLQLRSLASTCANCHGTDGRAVVGSAIPALAGLPRGIIAAQMLAFRDGSRPGTVMPQIAKGFSAEQIDALAAYFATVK